MDVSSIRHVLLLRWVVSASTRAMRHSVPSCAAVDGRQRSMDDPRPDLRMRPSKAAREVGATGPRPAIPSTESSDASTTQTGSANAGSANAGSANAGSASTPKKRKIKTTVIRNDGSPSDASPTNADSSPGMWSVVRERLAGEYAVDDFGFDPEFTDKVLFAGCSSVVSPLVPGRGFGNPIDSGSRRSPRGGQPLRHHRGGFGDDPGGCS